MLLSIVIPSYNHEKYVLKTIRAAARIDVPDKEIIAIDDGSSDRSANLIRDHIAVEGAGANIRLIVRENRGLVRTLNEGLALAQGKYLYLIASDDIPIAEGVTRLVEILEGESSLQFALGNALYMDSEEQTQFRVAHGEAHRRLFRLPFEQRRKQLFLRYPQPMLMQSAVFRASALRAIGGWREDIVVDDYSMFLRILSEFREVGRDFAVCPEVMVSFYRQHPANSYRNLNRQFAMVEQALEKLCPAEWRDAALLRNLIDHGADALLTRQWPSAWRFVRSTASHMGWARLMRLFAAEARKSMKARASGRQPAPANLVVAHDPAIRYIGEPRHV